ncbi:MAG TPA: CdaR family protein [Terriglobales bacterium]|nr:CdaR family protein [Terriglobales bacterium]
MNVPSPHGRSILARLSQRAVEGERWRAALTRNLPLKALSLVIAFALWAFVNFGERDMEATVKVPLELSNIPNGLVITGPRVDDIDVRLIGPRRLLGRLDGPALTIDLDLQGARPGPAVFPIGAERFKLPRGIRVMRITPAQITLQLERITTKSVPVQLRIEQQPPSDFSIAGTELIPDRVTVRGPVSVLRDIEMVTTEPVDLSRASAGVLEQELRLAVREQGISYDTQSVTARIRLEDVTVTRTFEALPVEVRAARGDVRIRPSTIVLTVEGPQRLIRGLTPESAIAWVDVTARGAGTFAAEPIVTLPAGVRIVAISPPQVEVMFAAGAVDLGGVPDPAWTRTP